VPEWPATAGSNTFQVVLHASGDVDVVYGALSNQNVAYTNTAVFGFTPGDGHPVGAPIDVSAAIVSGYAAGNNAIPPRLDVDARPVLGASIDVVTTDVTTGTLFSVLAVGSSAYSPALDLGVIGMPDCFLHSNAYLLLLQTPDPVSGDFVLPLPIPPNPALQGVTLVLQAAPLTVGYNALGLLTSNGLCLRIGDS